MDRFVGSVSVDELYAAALGVTNGGMRAVDVIGEPAAVFFRSPSPPKKGIGNDTRLPQGRSSQGKAK